MNTMIVKLMILALIVAFAGLFFIKGPGGVPILTLDDIKPETPDFAIVPDEPMKVYKWQDENGVWQFSNQPVEVGNVEVMELDGKINIIPAEPVMSQNAGGVTKPLKNPGTSGISSIPSGLTSVSPKKIAEMMETINNLQGTVDERKAQMDRISAVKN